MQEKENYLTTREAIDSISEAETALGLLDSYEKEKESMTDISVAQLKSLGESIRTAKYQSEVCVYPYASFSLSTL